jgi:hypothetical protein
LRPRERSRIAPKNVTGKPTKPVGSANRWCRETHHEGGNKKAAATKASARKLPYVSARHSWNSVFWLFISNVIQIFLMPLIMIGQNLQGRHSEIRAEADFEVNVKAEREIEAILTHLENQNELILRIVKHLDADKP